jgi:hypothetical protein
MSDQNVCCCGARLTACDAQSSPHMLQSFCAAASPRLIDQVREHPPTHERPVGELRHHAPQVAPVLGQEARLCQIRVHLPVAVVVQQDVEALGYKVLYLPQEPAGSSNMASSRDVSIPVCWGWRLVSSCHCNPNAGMSVLGSQQACAARVRQGTGQCIAGGPATQSSRSGKAGVCQQCMHALPPLTGGWQSHPGLVVGTSCTWSC